MGACIRAPKMTEDKELVDAQKSFNVNEEYLNALRTKSCADFFSKFKIPEKEASSLCDSHQKSFDIILEPRQETIAKILESPILLMRKSDLNALMHKYFDISAEASKICSHLLKSMNQIQQSCQLMKRALANTIDNYSSEQFGLIIPNLHSFMTVKNPFSSPSKNDFRLSGEEYTSLLHHLKSYGRRVARRIKLIECLTKASKICIILVCGLVAAAAISLAVHSLSPLIMAPALFSLPIKAAKKKFDRIKFLRSGTQRKVGELLDITAKATYVLNKEFDTMKQLVARLHDEVEYNKARVQFCLEQRQDVFSLYGVLKELKKTHSVLTSQVAELEEHVCLCLVTINHTRALVIKGIVS